MTSSTVLEDLRQQSLQRICIDKSLWYPARAFGIATDRELAPLFMQFGDEAGFTESISFIIEAVRDCLANPLFKLDAARTTYYYDTYFKPSGDDYFTGGARMELNLTSARFREAVELFGPAPTSRTSSNRNDQLKRTDGLAELTKARKQSDFITLCVQDMCRLLDTDRKPKAFFASALFKNHHAAKRANLPRPARYNAHKIIRFGAKR